MLVYCGIEIGDMAYLFLRSKHASTVRGMTQLCTSTMNAKHRRGSEGIGKVALPLIK